MKISVFAPATVANLGCGFDSMGLALHEPGDELTISFNRENKIRIRKISGDGGKLSLDADKNTAGVAIKALLDSLDLNQGFDVWIKKKMPLGSGLGSSAASAVAGAFAANELLGRPYTREELILFAMAGEKLASGSAHADNAAPSMMGGIVLVRSYHPFEVISIPVPPKAVMVVIHPDVVVLTKDARAVLPKKISMKDGISQWSNTAALVAGMYNQDLELMGRAMEDHIAEPYRSALIPSFDKVKAAALENGAYACSISGSGPSMFALTDKKNAQRIARAMKKEFSKINIKSTVYISAINKHGVSRIY
jgi:homoserine kinase